MTDRIDIEALEAVAKAATPGPWTWHETETYCDGRRHPAGRLNGPAYAPDYEDSVLCRGDAAFVAALNPTVALALLTEIRQARAALLAVHDLASCRLRDRGPSDTWTNWRHDMGEIERVSSPGAT